MRALKYCLATMALALSGLSNAAPTVDLTGLGFVTYGDGQSYSMPIANYQYGYNTNNGPFAISSTPGAIKDLTVLATGTESGPTTTNNAGMDDAYSTPSGVSGSTFFQPSTGTNRGVTPTVAFNDANTWDASLASLKSFLAGEEMVFFFNNNNENSLGAASQTLAAWARIWITDATGTAIGKAYEFTNHNSPYNLTSEGGGGVFGASPALYDAGAASPGNPDGGTAGNTDFVLAGGQICVATGTGLLAPVPVSCTSTAAQLIAKFGPGTYTLSAPIDHNLGADHVAYVILFQELNDALGALFTANPANLADYTMHVDVRLGCRSETGPDDIWMDCALANGFGTALNNGYEQIFIGTARVGACPADDPLCNPTVPEPASLLLVATALTSIGLITRRRQSKKAPRTEA